MLEPIEDEANVDKRRAEVGLPSLSEYRKLLKRFYFPQKEDKPYGGPFHNTFTWEPESKTWNFLMRSKDKTGNWVVFAEDNLRRG